MTRTIEVPQLPWHGAKPLELALPGEWQVDVCNMAGYNRPAMNDDQIRVAIASPVGAPPIRELARGKSEVVILFDDLSRPTRAARIVPFVLDELALAGISDDRIRFVAAYGAHGPMNRVDLTKKLGEVVVARFPVYNHNIYENCTYVGTTSFGTEVSVNAEVMHCDFKIAINITCPHHMVGFSGGAKMIIPGVASIDTIMANHSMPKNQAGFAIQGISISDDNPTYNDMEEAATLVGLDITIQCIANPWGDSVALFAGALKPTHEASVQEAKRHYLTPKAEEKDIVIANAYTKANEWALALKVAGSVKKSGGDFVLIANAPEGMVVHYLSLAWGTTIGGRVFHMRGRRAIPPHFNRLIVYSEYPDKASMRFFEDSPKLALMTNWDDVLQALQEVHGDRAAVAVYPSADIAYFG